MTQPPRSPAWPPSPPGGSASPGWYPDTVGGSAAFRWWDGARWTQVVSESLWEPEPKEAPPYVPPARAVPSTPAQLEFELDEEEPRVSGPLLIGIAVAAVLVLVALGMVAFGGGSGNDPAIADEASDRSDDQRTGAGGREEAGDSGDRSRSRAEQPTPSPDDTPSVPVVEGWPVFEPLGEKWWTGDESVLPHSTVRHFTTEENYSGDDDWIATVMTGEIPEDVEADQELARTANRVAKWYARVAFGSGQKPEFETVNAAPTMVADRPAHWLRVRMPYRLERLEATSDDVDIVVIDLGPERRQGLFLAAVPNTHPELRKIADAARESLSLDE